MTASRLALKRKSGRSRRGFSLIEVMAAASLFAVGIAAIFSAFGNGAALLEHQRHTSHGIHLTEAVLEEILLWPSGDRQLVVGKVFGPIWFDSFGFVSPKAAGCPSSSVGLPPADPACRYRVTWSCGPGVIADVRVVTVTTDWQEREQLRSISFSTQRN